MAVSKKGKEKSVRGKGLFPTLKQACTCCTGAVVDAVDEVIGEPVVKDFLDDPVKSSVSRIKSYVTEHPDLRLAAQNVFNDAVEDVRKKKKKRGRGDSLSYRDAAAVARSSWDQLTMKVLIEDDQGNKAIPRRPSRAMAVRLAKKFMSKDGSMSSSNFMKYRKALMDALVKQTVNKKVIPRVLQYAASMTIMTALVATGRTKLNMTENVEKLTNLLLPSIVVGPLLGVMWPTCGNILKHILLSELPALNCMNSSTDLICIELPCHLVLQQLIAAAAEAVLM